MINNINKVLKYLELDDTGRYDNQFYIINFDSSDEYSKMYTRLSEKAINTEYPNFGTNTNNTTIKVTNYFDLDLDNASYSLFLIADFDNDIYYLKIGERV